MEKDNKTQAENTGQQEAILTKGRVIDAITAEDSGIHADSIIIQFKADEKSETLVKDFDGPFLNLENNRAWRKLCLFAITGKEYDLKSEEINNFELYRNTIQGHEIFITYDGQVFGIGKDTENMFFPDNYGLWDAPA